MPAPPRPSPPDAKSVTCLATRASPRRPGSTRPADGGARQHGHGEVAVDPLLLRRVGLQAVAQAEQALHPLPVPDERVEGRQQDVPPSARVHPARPTRRGRRRRAASSPRPSPRPGRWTAAPAARAGAAARGSTARSASVATPSERPAAATRCTAHSSSRPFRGQEVGRDWPARPGRRRAGSPRRSRQTSVADVEQPLGGDLRLGPVPPRSALLGPAQLVRRQRAIGAQAVQHLGRRSCPAPASTCQRLPFARRALRLNP